jgi:hypothetical protein
MDGEAWRCGEEEREKIITVPHPMIKLVVL